MGTVERHLPTASAVIADRIGDVAGLSLREIEPGRLGEHQVRIAVKVAGLNPVDWMIVESEEVAAAFGMTPPLGFGNDFAGLVVEVGTSVTRWSVGDRVFGGARGAAVATEVVLDEQHRSLHRTPDAITDLTAGVLDIAGRTASAAEDALAAVEGETVLVGAAGGGVGSILTQLLVGAGVRVLGTGSASSAAFISRLGAEPVAYGPGLVRRVSVAAGGSIAAAADLHGEDTATAALELGVPAHRIVMIASDTPPRGVRAVNGADAPPNALRRLTDLIAAGRLSVPIAGVYDLESFAQAVAHQRSRHVLGKVAITTGP